MSLIIFRFSSSIGTCPSSCARSGTSSRSRTGTCTRYFILNYSKFPSGPNATVINNLFYFKHQDLRLKENLPRRESLLPKENRLLRENQLQLPKVNLLQLQVNLHPHLLQLISKCSSTSSLWVSIQQSN